VLLARRKNEDLMAGILLFLQLVTTTMSPETVFSTINFIFIFIFFPSLTSYRQSHFMLEKRVITADPISLLSLFSRSSSAGSLGLGERKRQYIMVAS
jgi:hypothetical protein